jgi:DNA primase catalytic core
LDDFEFRNLVDRIKEETDIVEVIGRCLSLDRHNMACCPFHDDHTPSLSVNAKGQYFHCFGCGKAGDVFRFLELHEKKPFWEVFQELAQAAAIPVRSSSPEERKQFEQTRITEEIIGLTAQYYQDKITPEIRKHLNEERGFADELISRQQIGYALDSGAGNHGEPNLLFFLKEQGYTKSQAVEAGVLHENGREYFAGCIIFPHRLNGRVVYITGRGYPEKSHKKLLKDKVPLKHLFLESALRESVAIITEGETDTYTLIQAGFNACGILGVGGFGDELVGKCKNVETVYISLDGDSAGVNAALKIGELLGSKTRIVAFPEVTDPSGNRIKDWNELFVKEYHSDVKALAEAYHKLLDQALTILEFQIRQIPVDTQPRDTPRVLRPILTKIADLGAVEQEIYVDAIIDHFQHTHKISRQALRKDIQAVLRQQPTSGDQDIEILGDDYPRISPALDFHDGVGYVTVPLDVKIATVAKGTTVTKIAKALFLITSNREFIRLEESELYEQRGLLLRSQPYFMGSSRWQYKHIEEFRAAGSKVKPAQVFDMIRNAYDSHLDFRESDTSEIMALWTIGTYLFPVFESYPYISLTGERGSGKTKTLNVAEKLCFNAVCSSDMSSALLLLNAGYKRGGQAHRSKPETFEPQSFDVYSPKMIANIKGLEGVLENRCIPFVMLRTKNTDKANQVVSELGRDWAHSRHLLYSFALSFFKPIQEIYLKDATLRQIRPISGRAGELWYPLLSIAKFLDQNGCGGLFEQVMDVAITKAEDAGSEGLDDWTNALLLGLRDITQSKETGISTKDINEEMIRYLEDDKNAPSPRWIGATLKRFGLLEKSERTNRGYRYEIGHELVVDVMERYGV